MDRKPDPHRGPIAQLTHESWFLKIAMIFIIALIAGLATLGWSFIPVVTLILAIAILGSAAVIVLSIRKHVSAAFAVFIYVVIGLILLCMVPINPPGGLIDVFS